MSWYSVATPPGTPNLTFQESRIVNNEAAGGAAGIGGSEGQGVGGGERQDVGVGLDLPPQLSRPPGRGSGRARQSPAPMTARRRRADGCTRPRTTRGRGRRTAPREADPGRDPAGRAARGRSLLVPDDGRPLRDELVVRRHDDVAVLRGVAEPAPVGELGR